MRTRLGITMLILALCGCVTPPASFAPSRTNHVPDVVASPEQIRVYRTTKPKEPYDEIGAVVFEYSIDPGNGLAQALRKMKEAASKNGGNAIIDLKITPAGTIGTVVRFRGEKSGNK